YMVTSVPEAADSPIRVGLIGAGPWARGVTGPVFAAGPETQLAGVWSRTADHAAEVAGALGADAVGDVDALIDASDAVAIAVTPDAQPELAMRAVRAGRPVLLEKPIAADLDGATQLVDAIDAAGVGSLVMLTYRFHPLVPEFVRAARAAELTGGWGCFL